MAGNGQRRITIRDVAAYAGVSFKSVSNVVNDRPFVSEDLRQKVQRAIDELGYRPHSVARSLATRRTNILGIVLRAAPSDAHEDPFLSRFLIGVCATAGDAGFGILIQLLLSEEPIRRFADLFDHRQVDGLILFNPRGDDAPCADGGSESDLPAVRIGRIAPGTDGLAVDGDDENGAYAAVSHLIALGHRRIGMVANASHVYTVTRTRMRGYHLALEAHGLSCDPALVTQGHFTRQSGYEGAARLLDLPQPPTALFVSSDRMALGAISAVRARGLRIPEDIALVGYDDLFVTEYTNPPLTTVRAPIDAISAHATHMLIDAINGVDIEPRQVILPVDLVVRESCGARLGPRQLPQARPCSPAGHTADRRDEIHASGMQTRRSQTPREGR
jgi:LacI family transcriptional regulator